MRNLFYNIEKKKLESATDLHILTFDSMEEWDAEQNGCEPGYDIFVKMIGQLIFKIAEGRPVFASFPERKIQNMKLIRREGLKYKRIAISLPERFAKSIVSKISSRKSSCIGTGVTIYINEMEDFVKSTNLRRRANEWLFLFVGNEDSIKWPDYIPYYLSKKHHDYYGMESIKDSYFTVYQETCLNYLEIFTCNDLISKILRIAEGLCIENDFYLQERERSK